VIAPYRAWVVDEHDHRLGAREVGELVISSDEPWTTFAGYWNRPETTLNELRNFGFHTGDAARIDADGCVWWVDRVKDMIRRRGENISALQVELAVSGIDGVLEAAAFGVPSPFGEEDVAVAVVVNDGAQLTADAIAAAAARLLPRYAVPTLVRFVDELPKTPTGKLQKAVLKQHGAEGAEKVSPPDA
jgi:crotonobetaine/carnitine-CoA ligase